MSNFVKTNVPRGLSILVALILLLQLTGCSRAGVEREEGTQTLVDRIELLEKLVTELNKKSNDLQTTVTKLEGELDRSRVRLKKVYIDLHGTDDPEAKKD
ncbi:MAG: hypothetical protein JWM11_5307 [Planctomycetaceae bacterium]|nr:hypothetical protein [Planctomycetaceae bacterium]